jgi:hypothetical protein
MTDLEFIGAVVIHALGVALLAGFAGACLHDYRIMRAERARRAKYRQLWEATP